MNWRTKARIQNAIACLPEGFSDAAYYALQRRFGGLKELDPTERLRAGIDTWKRIQAQNINPVGKSFLEVGTGRMCNVPIAFWLMGAERTVSVDKNRYLREELVLESIRFIATHPNQIKALFGDLLIDSRYQELVVWTKTPNQTLISALDKFQVQYIAPGDASKTGLRDSTIDFVTSYTVFEHIPGPVLVEIVQESNRILKLGGLCVHCIDYSDHFAHGDKSIGKTNFLRFEDKEWDKLAGNRYMYMNRMRHDDYIEIFEKNGQEILSEEPAVDPKSLEVWSSGAIKPASKFIAKTPESLATTSSWTVTKPKK